MAATQVSFEIETQSAGTITNISGDQTVQIGEGPSTSRTIGRWIAAAGLAVLLAGVGLLIVTIVLTVQALLPMPPWPEDPYTQYVASTWLPAVILLGVGTVSLRFGRLFANR